MHRLLEGFDDWKRYVFFCLVASILALDDLLAAAERANAAASGMNLSDKAAAAEWKLWQVVPAKNAPLELRRWKGPS